MSIRLVDHVNIVTEKLQETREFYVRVLGLTEGPRPPFTVEGYWFYAGDRAVVHIQQAVRPVGSSHVSALNHAAFDVDDMDALLRSLDAHGVTYREVTIQGPTPTTQIRQAFFDDPNGVRLEFNSPRAVA